ncbi:MAG: hypothetical protein GTN62_04795 [Gemmatimonadales bacterium]|nr:hypothetical protein [Gemmatimonadales bacterium]NIN10656.1 hypothetical protein [Gemmatimonadales bacterium]NIN49418.1 hypothetical protein [Gemmatimonadales bacterium]NIP06882.1 hypothetical protein [Gemmatimonadales bacterium]NIR01556.1 hypothetical protein [Gemmatimonadales bacterium]
MRQAITVSGLIVAVACGAPDLERMRTDELTGAFEAFRTNIAAIHKRDVEAYLAHYVDSPDLVIATADSLRRGFLLFAEARRASDEWPDTLIAGRPTLVWVGPGVVWGAFEYTSVQRGDTSRGWSERLFVKTGGGWKIVVTGQMERCGG